MTHACCGPRRSSEFDYCARWVGSSCPIGAARRICAITLLILSPIRLGKCQPACKPGSVGLRTLRVRNVTAIHLGRLSPGASSNQPGWSSRNTLRSCLSTARRPPLFDLAPGGVCPANPVARLAVGSYPTFSPLPPALCSKKGGIVSVALSLGSPPPDVIRHRFPWSPDFPLTFYGQRPSGRLAGCG